jgi:hypothetical protein
MGIACIKVGIISDLGAIYENRNAIGNFTRSWKTIEFLFRWHQEAKKLSRKTATHPYSDNNSRDEAFWRTLIADSVDGKIPAPQNQSQYYEFWVDMLDASLQDHGAGGTKAIDDTLQKHSAFLRETFSNFNPGMDRAWNSYPPAGKSRGVISEMARQDVNHYLMLLGQSFAQVLSAIPGRRFCVTDEGYVGLAPPGAQVGDLVCIVLGAQVPFLLREFHEHDKEYTSSISLHRLVGECYIQGMMRGERMNEERKKIFTLI